MNDKKTKEKVGKTVKNNKNTNTNKKKSTSVCKDNNEQVIDNKIDLTTEVKSKAKKLPTWALAIIIIVGLFFIIQIALWTFAILFSTNYGKYEVTNGIVSISKGDLTITSDVAGYYNDVDHKYYVVGYLHNNSDEEYNDLTINYTIYDVKGNILGTATAYTEKIMAKKTWKFKAIYDNIDANEGITFEFSGFSY